MTRTEYNDSVTAYSDDLFRFALRYTGDTAESEDAVQDCYLLLWEERRQVETATVKGYLMRMLYRRLVDRHRHLAVERATHETLRPQEEGYNQHGRFELHDAMQQALAQLPEMQRKLVLLHDLEGYSYAEMAALSGLSEQQVGVYLFRARKTMKQLLEEYRYDNQ